MGKPSTQKSLLEAALEVFAECGYAGASTRTIAAKAGANIAAIPYYFSGKEGLYRAALGAIAERVGGRIRPLLEEIGAKLAEPETEPEELRRLFFEFLRRMIAIFDSDTVSPAMVQLFIREQQFPTPAFDELYKAIIRKAHETYTALFARLTGLAHPSEEATLGAHALLGQVLIFKTHHELIRRRLGWQKYGPAEQEKITRTVLFQAGAALEAYHV